MASVGEPINRPRHTGQRDRSQTVLAAPRDTYGPHLIKPPGVALTGRPGVGKLSFGASHYRLRAEKARTFFSWG